MTVLQAFHPRLTMQRSKLILIHQSQGIGCHDNQSQHLSAPVNQSQLFPGCHDDQSEESCPRYMRGALYQML